MISSVASLVFNSYSEGIPRRTDVPVAVIVSGKCLNYLLYNANVCVLFGLSLHLSVVFITRCSI